MKTKLSCILPVLFAVFSLIACKKDNDAVGETPKKDYATLKVTVELETDSAIVALPGAKIYLYEEEIYQDEGTHVIFDATTDALGKAAFFTLEKPEYYITVVAPSGKRQAFYENFPARSTTFLPVIFEKD